MLTISIETPQSKRRIRLPEQWSDITFDEYMKRYHSIDIPDKIQQYYTETEERDKVVEQMDWIEYLVWMRECIVSIADIDESQVNDMPDDEVNKLFKALEPYIIGDFQGITPLRSFSFKGKTYRCAESKFDLASKELKLGHANFGEFVEALQVQQAAGAIEKGMYEEIPFLIACLWRPIMEKYSEAKVIERGKLFRGLSMDVVAGCTFFLTRHALKSLTSSQSSSRERAEPTRSSGSLAGTCNWLNWRGTTGQSWMKLLKRTCMTLLRSFRLSGLRGWRRSRQRRRRTNGRR